MSKVSCKKKVSRSSTSHGYILTSYPSPRALYRHIWSLTAKIPFTGTPQEVLKQRKKYHRFLSHLYISSRLQVIDKESFNKRQGFIPISSRFIEREFGRDFDVHLLRKWGLIKIKGHDTARHKSREYRLKEKISRAAIKIEFENTLSVWKDLLKGRKVNLGLAVNLMTGRSESSPVKSEYTKYEGGIRNTNLPKLIKNSMKSFEPCPFNPKYVIQYVGGLKNKYKRTKSKLKKIKALYGKDSQEYSLIDKEFLKARGRYQNDSLSMKTIINQAPIKMKIKSKYGDPIYQYKAAYSVQVSGRLTEIHGGFQSASKYFKRSFFRGILHLKMNYDLQSSQAYILLQELEACNLKCNWLEMYLEDPKSKKKFAKKVGVIGDVWKKCFYALIMGANAKSRLGGIFGHFKDRYPGKYREAEKAHKRFMKITGELIVATEKWRDYIYTTHDRRYHYQHDGVKYWKNACGMHFKNYGMIEDKDGKPVLIDRLHGDEEVRTKGGINKCKRKLAAFILQGQEACFIHHLTIICAENGIPVYKNEHDGLITGEKIPKKLVKKAAKLSGLNNPVLKRKSLCSKDKRKETRKFIET